MAESAFPSLTEDLRSQLQTVPESFDGVGGGISYRPCVVSLRDGSTRDCVYVQEVEPYFELWGVLPDDDPGKTSVSLSDVETIVESQRRLPIAIANRIYASGETGMGYFIFTLIFDDGREVACLTGNAVDFVALPDHLDPRRIARVRIGVPRGLEESDYAASADYAWCLYSGK